MIVISPYIMHHGFPGFAKIVVNARHCHIKCNDVDTRHSHTRRNETHTIQFHPFTAFFLPYSLTNGEAAALCAELSGSAN